MDTQSKLDALLNLAAGLGLTIRHESLGGEGGGFCVMKGARILFVDLAADTETRYERTLDGFASLPEADQHYLPPEVRDDLDRRRTTLKQNP